LIALTAFCHTNYEKSGFYTLAVRRSLWSSPVPLSVLAFVASTCWESSMRLRPERERREPPVLLARSSAQTRHTLVCKDDAHSFGLLTLDDRWMSLKNPRLGLDFDLTTNKVTALCVFVFFFSAAPAAHRACCAKGSSVHTAEPTVPPHPRAQRRLYTC
jgi:hypothetical protein